MKSDIACNRLQWPDIVKGIGIILVVITHTNILPSFLIKWIFTFHVPVFFFISGLFYKKCGYKTYIRKKSKGLLKPYFEYALAFFIVDFIIEGEAFIPQIPDRLFEVFLGKYSALWFLMALFVCEILLYLVDNISAKELIKVVIIIVFVLLGAILIHFDVDLPFYFINAIMMLPFLYTGQLVRKYNLAERINKRLVYAIILTLAVNIGFCCLNSFCDVRRNEYGNLIYFYVSGMAGTFMLSLCAIAIRHLDILELIGRNTLCIFALNTFIPLRLSKLSWAPGGLIRKLISALILIVAVAISEWSKRKKKVNM